jgi:hypothetical protein
VSDYWLHFTLKSDTTFGRGDGVAGLVDREVEHDHYGLPFLRGRTLKGLLREETDNLLYAVWAANGRDVPERWLQARNNLFGQGGSDGEGEAAIHYGRAHLPTTVREQVAASNLSLPVVLNSLTALRRQTAVGTDGVPIDGSLRTMRVILRETPFVARLRAARPLTEDEEALLAATVLAWRRAGTGRNRGRGRLQSDLLDAEGDSLLRQGYERFTTEVLS